MRPRLPSLLPADAGAGSLRAAIDNANIQPNVDGPDRIQFAIAGNGVHTITLSSQLPILVDPVIIDGTSQPGFTGTPVIELNGQFAGTISDGLTLQTSNCVIRGLAINRFGGSGIRIETGYTNVIEGNFIGTGPYGTNSLGNRQTGIFILHGAGNRVGGSGPGAFNLISGNIGAGIYIFECDSRGNAIQGNFIGTTLSGMASLANRTNGIVIDNAPGNLVGGTLSAERNVISGNGLSGILVYGQCAIDNIISGNFIGTDVAGTGAVSNSTDGVTLYTAGGNTVGGIERGAGNIISGNGQRGITITGPGAAGNLIQGNHVGTDFTGTLALGNALGGLTLTRAWSNVIGGTVTAARNLISGNRQSGVVLGTNSIGNRVEGNFIGVDVTATTALGNLFNGITLQDASGNFVGAAGGAGRNILSGNAHNGIFITGVKCTNNTVQGNIIGADLSGTVALGNGEAGVWIESSRNLIGGCTPLPCNLISGNGTDGVLLLNSGATLNQVQGNYIGTDITGAKRLSNQRAGIGISAAPANIIGGVDGTTGNLISGNDDAGIFLVGTGANRNQIAGNRIGTDASGMLALGNSIEGIYLDGASTNALGGMANGMGNLISANLTRGIFLTNASWNTIQGNMVGTALDGIGNLGNAFHSIELESRANNNEIGPGNRVAYTKTTYAINYAGIRIRDGSTNNLIWGNSIFGNAGLGIDLGTARVTANDNCDADTGANLLQNFPLLARAYTGNGTSISGTLNTAANRSYVLHFYASPACHAYGNGEGQIYLGMATVNTGANCVGNFAVNLQADFPAGYSLTATATDANNNTSEFSPCIVALPKPGLTINRVGASQTGQLTFTWPDTTLANFHLYQTDSLAEPIVWLSVTNAPVLQSGSYTITMSGTNDMRFYHLRLD